MLSCMFYVYHLFKILAFNNHYCNVLGTTYKKTLGDHNFNIMTIQTDLLGKLDMLINKVKSIVSKPRRLKGNLSCGSMLRRVLLKQPYKANFLSIFSG